MGAAVLIQSRCFNGNARAMSIVDAVHALLRDGAPLTIADQHDVSRTLMSLAVGMMVSMGATRGDIATEAIDAVGDVTSEVVGVEVPS